MVRLVVSGPYHAGAFSFHLPSEMQLNLCPFAENTRNNYLLESQALGQLPPRCYTCRRHVPFFRYCLPRGIHVFFKKTKQKSFQNTRKHFQNHSLDNSEQFAIIRIFFVRVHPKIPNDVPAISVLFFFIMKQF